MNREAQQQAANALEWMWIGLLLPVPLMFLMLSLIGPLGDAAASPWRDWTIAALVIGFAGALPAYLAYMKFNALRFRAPAIDLARHEDRLLVQRRMVTGCLAAELPFVAGAIFFLMTGNSTVLLMLSGVSVGMQLAFRPGSLIKT
jgi:hypothetical protein